MFISELYGNHGELPKLIWDHKGETCVKLAANMKDQMFILVTLFVGLYLELAIFRIVIPQER